MKYIAKYILTFSLIFYGVNATAAEITIKICEKCLNLLFTQKVDRKTMKFETCGKQ